MRDELQALEEILKLCERLTVPEFHYLVNRIHRDLMPKARQKALAREEEVRKNETR